MRLKPDRFANGIEDEFRYAFSESPHFLVAARTQMTEVGSVYVQRLRIRERAGREIDLERVIDRWIDIAVGESARDRGRMLRQRGEYFSGLVTISVMFDLLAGLVA